MKKLAVVAFGGNALLRSGQKGTYSEQIKNVTETCDSLVSLLKQDYNLVIGHGNGPQVGNVMLQHEAGKNKFNIEAMPMDFCVAETQGSIGYLIEQGFRNVFAREGLDRNVLTLLTQVVVDKNDPAFNNPVKPVGPYYTKEEAAGWILRFTPDAELKRAQRLHLRSILCDGQFPADGLPRHCHTGRHRGHRACSGGDCGRD